MRCLPFTRQCKGSVTLTQCSGALFDPSDYKAIPTAVFCFMLNDKSSKSKPAPPHCPSCALIMRLARKTRRFNGLPDLYIFECRTCDMSHTEEGAPPNEPKLRTEIGSWYLDEFGNPTREIKGRD